MKYGFLLTLLGLTLLYLAVRYEGVYLLLLWPAGNFLWAGRAYLKNNPLSFGKQSDGSLSLIHRVLLFPYFMFTWSIWHVLRLVQTEQPYNELDQDIIFGRRLLSAELPPQIKSVLDLTSEFPRPEPWPDDVQYFSFSILDGAIPEMDRIDAVVDLITQMPKPLYLHCAQGHGRTGMMVACWLLQQSPAATPACVVERILETRPRVGFNSDQRRVIELYEESLRVRA